MNLCYTSSQMKRAAAPYLIAMICAAFAALFPALAMGADRVALLIGNSEYQQPAGADRIYLPRIPMPAKDLQLMEGMLKKAGFECATLANQTTAQMRAGIKKFSADKKG